MISAIIIDDEEMVAKSLELMIRKYVSEIEVIGTTSNPHKAVDLVNELKPELIFLDVYMPGLDGFELLEQLSFRNFHLVFTTAHEEFGLKALKQNAFDYLLKPVDLEELEKLVKRIKDKRRSNPENAIDLLMQVVQGQEQKVALPLKDTIEYVLPREIICIEADRKYTTMGLRDGRTVQVSRSLKSFEQELCGKELDFLRVNNSFIININFVIRFVKKDKGHIVMQNGKVVPLSKEKREEVLKLLKPL